MGEIRMDLRLVFKIPESELTINGLIRGLKEGGPQIQGAILTTLLNALEEKEIQRLREKDPERYRRNGHQSKPRCLRCSRGEISFRFAQMVDRKTGHTFMPLVEALSIPVHDHFLEEAMERSVGLVMHVSFRRAQSEVERIQGTTMSDTTVHRRLQEFATTHSPFGEMKHLPFRFLLVDGTKVHLQGLGGKNLGQAEMCWTLASLQTQEGFRKLLEVLDGKTYPRARTYIQNLIQPVTTFLSWWLKKGEVIPLNTNAIESAFSQVCNRIKRVGRRWSDKGLLNWLQVAFYKIFKGHKGSSLLLTHFNQKPNLSPLLPPSLQQIRENRVYGSMRGS